MKSQIFALVVVIALSTMSTSHAQVGVTASLGTPGAGVHLSLPVANQLNARFGLNGLSYSRNGNTNNVDYDFKLKMATGDALLDYFPSDGRFRFTGGIAYDGNKIEANGRPSTGGIYTLNGHIYPSSSVGRINGQIDFRKVAPYLGIGWGKATSKTPGWGFAADIGVLFQGRPNSTLTNRGCTASALVCAQVALDVAIENRSLQDDVSSYRAFPVLRLGVIHSF